MSSKAARTAALFLCLALVLCLLPGRVSAAAPVLVTQQSDITTALDAAVSGDTVDFVLQNDMTWGDDGTTSMVVKAGVNVTITNAPGVNVTVKRKVSLSVGLYSRIDIHGSLTVRNNPAGGTLTFDGEGTFFKDHPQFAVLGDGSKLTIESGIFENHSCGAGGVINNTDGALTTISGGIFRNNENTDPYGNCQGGVIYAANSSLTITGGDFTGNTATLTGGVVFYEGRVRTCKLRITGGNFTENTANSVFGGGAVFIDCNAPNYSLAEISGGIFTRNSAPNGLGGAIYIQRDAEVKISNAYIYANAATHDGGGVWNCPQGSGDYYTFHGMYLANNTAGSEGADFFSEPKAASIPALYLSDYASTGDKYDWKYDENDARRGQPAPNDYYQHSLVKMALKSSLPEKASLATGGGMAVFTGNTSKDGAAIANNGFLQFGEETKLSINKQTTTPTSETFRFAVSLTREGAGMSGSFVYTDSASGSSLGRIQFNSAGEATLSLKAGQTISILDLPVHATFRITEISIPDGWTLQSSVHSSGTIQPGAATAPVLNAVFTNTLGSAVPKTGDTNHAALWTALAVLAAGGILLLRRVKLRRGQL